MKFRFSALILACLIGNSFAVDPRIEQGGRFEAQGEFEKALGEYRAILAEQPQNSQAYFAAAEVYVKMPKPDYSRALANYRLAYKFTPNMSEAYEGAAKVYERLGQKSKADAERAKDPKNNPTPEPVAEVAPAAAAESVAAEPAPVATPAPVAETPKVEEPAPVAAPAPVAEAPKAEPAPAAAPVPVAEAPKAEPVKTAETVPAVSSDPFEKGKALLAEGKYKEAAPLWREVLSKQPGHAGAYFYAGVTRYEMGEFEKAEFNLKKGIDYKDCGNDANYYLALVYQKTKRPELEKKSLAAYLKKAAPDGKFRKAAEDRLAQLNAPAETAPVAAPSAGDQSAVASAPVAESPKVELAGQAVAQPAETAAPVAESGTNSIANANLLFKAGSYEAALQMYKALLETEQKPEERYFTMLQVGNVYRELRDFHSAVTRYREVVQQYPDSDWATEAERALEDAVWLEKHSRDLPARKR